MNRNKKTKKNKKKMFYKEVRRLNNKRGSKKRSFRKHIDQIYGRKTIPFA